MNCLRKNDPIQAFRVLWCLTLFHPEAEKDEKYLLNIVNRWKIKNAVIEYNHMIMRHSNVTQKYKNTKIVMKIIENVVIMI